MKSTKFKMGLQKNFDLTEILGKPNFTLRDSTVVWK